MGTLASPSSYAGVRIPRQGDASIHRVGMKLLMPVALVRILRQGDASIHPIDHATLAPTGTKQQR